MTITLPAVVSLIGAIAFFNFAVKLRHFKVQEKPPASRAHVSLEERQRKVQIERWTCFAAGWFRLAGAFLCMACKFKLRDYRLVA
jgi:hypothetical protein